jgi:hypothetical protein
VCPTEPLSVRRTGCVGSNEWSVGRPRNAQVFADLAGEKVIDLGMTRNGRGLSVSAMDNDSVVAAFAKDHAAIRFEVPQQLSPLHELTTRTPE